VLIDRDGVINRDSDEYIKSVDEWQPLPGSLEAMTRLRAAGFRLAVVTNQSGVGRGLFTEATLRAIHGAMQAAVKAAGGEIAGVFYCPHRPDEACWCRKPNPGLLEQAADALGFDLAGVPFIGDKASDIEAARAAGARPILVGTRSVDGIGREVERFADLAAAADALIAEHQGAA
jgi:D-glycero-D-manno-heptose 1,7-bisphosphate phosphatase